MLGLLSPALVTLIEAAPHGPVEAAAGLGLLPVLAAALAAALLASPGQPPPTARDRLPAVITFLVAAAGSTVFGIGPAFWALLAGLACAAVLRAGRRPQTPSAA